MVNKYDNYELKRVTSLENVPGTIKDGDGYIWDPSELPDKDFDDSKVPLNYRRLAIWMRSKLFGKEVRETIARLAEMFGLNFKELMESFESLDDRQETVESFIVDFIQAATDAEVNSGPEIIQMRDGEPTANARLKRDYNQISSRLERDYNQISSQLDDTTAQLVQTKNELDAKKLDKNRGAVTSADLSQEVKEQMTGGSVAVVGENAVNTENIIDKSVTSRKVSDDVATKLLLRNIVMNSDYEILSSLDTPTHFTPTLASLSLNGDGDLVVTPTGRYANVYNILNGESKDVEAVVGHKYYASSLVKTTSLWYFDIYQSPSQAIKVYTKKMNGGWERLSGVFTNGFESPRIRMVNDTDSTNPLILSKNGFVVVDLTEAFGAGNEPNLETIERFIFNASIGKHGFYPLLTTTIINGYDLSSLDNNNNNPETLENYCEINIDKVDFAFKDRGRDLKIGMGKRGPNNIFDFTTIEENINSLPSINTYFSDYTPVLVSGTDWFGPYKVKANNNIDGDNIDSVYFTGGNHGYDNTGLTTGNSATGRTTSVEFYVDGRKEDTYSGSFNRLKIIWTNRIQGNNTTKVDGSGREILEETFRAEISNGKVNVFAEIKALEDITIDTYYGLQTVFRENEQTYQFIGGTNRGIYQTEVEGNSGDKSCVGVILKGNLNLKMMIDPIIGIGDNKLAVSSPTYSFRRVGSKMYGNLIRGDFSLPEDNVLYYAGQYDFTF